MNMNDFQRDLFQRAVYKATFGKPKKHRSVELWPALDYLTIAFISLRLTGHISWSWWAVLSPTIVNIVITGFTAALVARIQRKLGYLPDPKDF